MCQADFLDCSASRPKDKWEADLNGKLSSIQEAPIVSFSSLCGALFYLHLFCFFFLQGGPEDRRWQQYSSLNAFNNSNLLELQYLLFVQKETCQ